MLFADEALHEGERGPRVGRYSEVDEIVGRERPGLDIIKLFTSVIDECL